jgi:PTH1 family peptidyl-tRNA hydrolase
VKQGGGNSGHNGLRSLDQALRSADYVRVRVGIGRPPGRQDPADFVLQPVGARDEADLALLVSHAADAVRASIVDGLERTQDRFNRSTPQT